MQQVNVDLQTIHVLSNDLSCFIEPGFSLAEDALVKRAEEARRQSGVIRKEALEKIAIMEAKIACCVAQMPAAAAEDALSAAAGEYAGRVEELQQTIERCEMNISVLRFCIEECETVEQNLQRYQDDYIGRQTDMLADLQDRVNSAAVAANEFYRDLSTPLGSSVPGGTIEADICRLMGAKENAIGELAYLGGAYADSVAHESAAKDLDAIKEASGSLHHRSPAQFGTWLDNAGTRLPARPDISTGRYLWSPDKDRVFGDSRTNPRQLTARQVCDLYSFETIAFVDGYPVFPQKCIVATMSLSGLLTAKRPKNFKEADELFVASGCSCVGQATRLDVASFMRLYEGVGEWFTDASQVEAYRKSRGLTWHETQDMRDVQLIHREVHAMVAHDGGRSNASYRDSIEKDMRYLAKAALEALLSE